MKTKSEFSMMLAEMPVAISNSKKKPPQKKGYSPWMKMKKPSA